MDHFIIMITNLTLQELLYGNWEYFQINIFV